MSQVSVAHSTGPGTEQALGGLGHLHHGFPSKPAPPPCLAQLTVSPTPGAQTRSSQQPTIHKYSSSCTQGTSLFCRILRKMRLTMPLTDLRGSCVGFPKTTPRFDDLLGLSQEPIIVTIDIYYSKRIMNKIGTRKG